MNIRKMPTQFYRDAVWVASFGKGTLWGNGDLTTSTPFGPYGQSGFRLNREKELIAAGVLVPIDDQPGTFRVGEMREIEGVSCYYCEKPAVAFNAERTSTCARCIDRRGH